jgi:hypothetical protein
MKEKSLKSLKREYALIACVTFASSITGAYLMFSCLGDKNNLYITTPKRIEATQLERKETQFQQIAYNLNSARNIYSSITTNSTEISSEMANLEKLCETETQKIKDQLETIKGNEDYLVEVEKADQSLNQYTNKLLKGLGFMFLSVLPARILDRKNTKIKEYKNSK